MGDKAVARIGTSGYQYDHWREVFYPRDLPQDRWFRYYAERFETVEINNTFYHLPEIKSFEEWRDQAPPGFCFALKYSRYGSHMKRLKDPREALDKFVRRADTLGGKVSVVLVQLPPHWKANAERLEGFLKAAPTNFRWAVEMRDATWLSEEIYQILRRHNAALCIHDLLESHPQVLTADWTYLRFHGTRYQGAYDSGYLAGQAEWIRGQLAAGRDVYAYFNNDQGGQSVRDATELRRHLGQLA